MRKVGPPRRGARGRGAVSGRGGGPQARFFVVRCNYVGDGNIARGRVELNGEVRQIDRQTSEGI